MLKIIKKSYKIERVGKMKESKKLKEPLPFLSLQIENLSQKQRDYPIPTRDYPKTEQDYPKTLRDFKKKETLM